MAQEKDDFKRLSEKYENELMNYYRAHAPTVLSYSGNTRSIVYPSMALIGVLNS